MPTLAIAPVSPTATPLSAPPAAPHGGGGFSKALDDAAQRRTDDASAAPGSKPYDAADRKARGEESPDAAQAADAAPGDEPQEAAPATPIDPALWQQIPLRPGFAGERSPIAGSGQPADPDGADPLAGSAASAAVGEVHLPAESTPAGATDRSRGAIAAGPVPADTVDAARNDAPPITAADAPGTVRDAAVPVASGAPAQGGALPALTTAASLVSPSASTTPVAAGAPAEAHVPVPLEHPGFGAALGTQLSLMARDGVKQARLHLNPAELGPVQVQITVTGQLARVDLVSEQALTRQVLEQSMPSLASSLRESGLTLAGGGVFEQPRQADRDPAQPQRQAGRGAAADDGESVVPASDRPLAAGRSRGVVDLYA